MTERAQIFSFPLWSGEKYVSREVSKDVRRGITKQNAGLRSLKSSICF